MDDHSVILFDGICNLCNHAVQFVINHDQKKVFLFATLDSEIGLDIFKKYHLTAADTNTFILLENNRVYTRSTAALHVAGKLNGIIRVVYIFYIIPKSIRDSIYNFIAKNRYRWFGKKEHCMVPTAELKARFLN